MKRKQPKSTKRLKVRRQVKHYGELGGRHEQATGYKRQPKHKETQWNQDM